MIGYYRPSFGDLSLVAVVECETEGVAERRERALCCIGLSRFESDIMSNVRLWGSPTASADAFSNRCGLASTDRYPHFRRVEADSLATLLLGPMAGRRQRLPIPVLETEDTVGFRYRMPALNVCYRNTLALANFHVPPLELRSQRPNL